MNHQLKFESLNLSLPPAPEPKGVYVPLLQVGNLVYLSGHLPVNADGTLIRGKEGKDLDMEAGKIAATGWIDYSGHVNCKSGHSE